MAEIILNDSNKLAGNLALSGAEQQLDLLNKRPARSASGLDRVRPIARVAVLSAPVDWTLATTTGGDVVTVKADERYPVRTLNETTTLFVNGAVGNNLSVWVQE